MLHSMRIFKDLHDRIGKVWSLAIKTVVTHSFKVFAMVSASAFLRGMRNTAQEVVFEDEDVLMTRTRLADLLHEMTRDFREN